MQPYQIRVRKMRRPGRKLGRSADGIRQHYYDPDLRAAREAAEEAARTENQAGENQP